MPIRRMPVNERQDWALEVEDLTVAYAGTSTHYRENELIDQDQRDDFFLARR